MRSTGATVPQKVYLASGLPEGSKASDLQTGFTRELAAALERRGVSVQEGSPFGVTVAVALAPADMGITQSAGSSGQAVIWSEAPRKHGMFDGCHPQRLRVVLSGTAGADAPQKLAEGEVVACHIAQAQSAALAAKLAEDLTRR